MNFNIPTDLEKNEMYCSGSKMFFCLNQLTKLQYSKKRLSKMRFFFILRAVTFGKENECRCSIIKNDVGPRNQDGYNAE